MEAKARYRVHGNRLIRGGRMLPKRMFKEFEMQKPADIDIVRRAYERWEQAGEPDGRDQEFYHQGEQEMQQANEPAIPEQPR
jgi:hypothetical protein